MLRPFDFVRVKPSYFESQPPPMSLPLSFGVHTAGELKEKEAARERLDKNDRENIGPGREVLWSKRGKTVIREAVG